MAAPPEKTAGIRSYRPADLSDCRQLWAELTQHHRDLYGDPTIGGGDPGAGIDPYLAEPRRRATWVAEADGRVVGLAGMLVDGQGAEVEPVIVSRRYRGRGIGTMLVSHAVQEARKIGVRFLSVRPVARNSQAVRFFAKLGFDLVGHVELFRDLSASSERTWERGPNIHGLELRH